MFWSQHVDFPTHSDGNILDLVLSSESELVHSISDLGMLGKGDHTMMEVVVTGPGNENHSKELVPDWQKADLDAMKAAIDEIDWETELEGMSGVEAWEYFEKKLEHETERCVPKKLRRVGKKNSLDDPKYSVAYKEKDDTLEILFK